MAGAATMTELLRNPLAVIAPAVATFLAVFVLLVARAATRHDPTLGPSVSSSAQASSGGHPVLRTTASGRVIAAAGTGATAAPSPRQPAAIVTRASGALATGRENDG